MLHNNLPDKETKAHRTCVKVPLTSSFKNRLERTSSPIASWHPARCVGIPGCAEEPSLAGATSCGRPTAPASGRAETSRQRLRSRAPFRPRGRPHTLAPTFAFRSTKGRPRSRRPRPRRGRSRYAGRRSLYALLAQDGKRRHPESGLLDLRLSGGHSIRQCARHGGVRNETRAGVGNNGRRSDASCRRVTRRQGTLCQPRTGSAHGATSPPSAKQ